MYEEGTKVVVVVVRLVMDGYTHTTYTHDIKVAFGRKKNKRSS